MPLLEVIDLYKYFTIKQGLLAKPVILRAVDGVSFNIEEGETLGLVGESGSGKTTVGKLVLRLIEPTRVKKLEFMGVDLTRIDDRGLRKIRRYMSVVYQNPSSSLNPWWTVGKIIEEPLVRQGYGDPDERRELVEAIMERVGLPLELYNRYPGELSGGQQQRVAIARALITKPKFMVADEPTSSLDASVRASILNLMKELQREFNISYLFISHDLATIRYIADKVAVMYMGEIVELGRVDTVLREPLHPYTQGLLKSVPKIGKKGERFEIKGEIPSLTIEYKHCKFSSRCPFAFEKCRAGRPGLKRVGDRLVACFLYD